MYVLDTDTLSLVLRGLEPYPRLEQRIRSTPPELLWVSIVTAEELLRGAFDLIRREEARHQGTDGYRLFADLLMRLGNYQILMSDIPCLIVLP